jgi:DNA-binding transcriptional LysR family regulator
LEMHHIRYFLAVSETLNLTKAAERCNVAQPALTRAIKALESELGGELLRRERSLSHLTELGRRILPMLRQCYDTALSAKVVAASINKGEVAPLSIAVSNAVTLAPFANILRELSRALPGLELNLYRGSGDEVAEHLKSGTAELAITGPLGAAWARLDALPLFEEPFALVVTKMHRLANKTKGEFEDLASETILVNAGCEMANELGGVLKANGISDAVIQKLATQDDLLTLLKAGLGVGIIPVGAMDTNELRRIPLDGLNLLRGVSAYTVAGRQRGVACATLFNMLRAADWGFDASTRSRMKVRA